MPARSRASYFLLLPSSWQLIGGLLDLFRSFGGDSAGGLATFLHIDTMTDYIHAANTAAGVAGALLKDGTELSIGGHSLRQLPTDGYPESLTRIDASDNQLTSLPPALADIVPALEAIDVSRNGLRGLPADLDACARLRSVRAARNALDGLGFVNTVLPSLTELVADRNAIGALPAAPASRQL